MLTSSRKAVAVVWAIHFLVSLAVVWTFFTRCTEGGSLPGGMCSVVLVAVWAFAGLALLGMGVFWSIGVALMALMDSVLRGVLPYEVTNLVPTVVGLTLPVALSSLLWAIVLVAGYRSVRRLRERGTGT